MMWTEYLGKVTGVRVEGDKTVSPTRWWNHLWLVLVGWKVVTVFEVSAEDAEQGYRIGYIAFDGKTMVESTVHHDRRFRMKNGHEDCSFFAVTINGREVPLTIITRTVKNDATHQGAPLH